MFSPIKTLHELDPSKVTSAQALRIFTTKKNFAVLAFGKLHLTNEPKRLIMENYRMDEALDIDIFELS